MTRPTHEGQVRPLLTGEISTGTFDGDDNGSWPTGPVGDSPSPQDQWKQPVRVATTANITISTALNSGDTIDGVTLADGDRVLVKNQTTGSQNGIYVAGTTPARAADMDDSTEVVGALVYVVAGSTNGGKAFKNTNTSAPTIDTTSLTFTEFAPSSTPTGGTQHQVLGNSATNTPAWVDQWFNVRAYGAIGDDSTDDTTAIAAAISACAAAGGGTVYFPAGTYKITSALTITAAHVNLLGEGNEYGPSIIHQTSTNTTALNFSSTWADDSWTYHSSVRGLLIIGPATTGSPASSGRGIYARSHINVENVGIVGFYDGLYWDNRTYYSRAYGLFISSCTHAGIVMVTTNNCTVDTCRIFGDDSRTAPTVAGRRIFGAMQYGIVMSRSGDDGKNNRIVNSVIEYFTYDGIYVDGSLGLVITGTYFEENGQSSSGHAHINLGPSSTYCGATLITGNHFNGYGTSGFDAIKSDKATGVFLTANDFGSYQAIRVNFAGSTTNVIEGANYFNPSPTNVWTSDTVHLGSALADPMTTRGDMVVRNSSNVTARLATGSAGTVLASNGTDPSWTAPGGDISGAIGAVTVGKLQGRALASTAPSDGQAIVWDSGGSTWKPGTVASSSGSVDHQHVMDVLMSGDGSTTAFELPAAPFDAYSVAAYVAGTLTEVTLSGTLLTTATFGSAPASGTNNIRFDIVAAAV